MAEKKINAERGTRITICNLTRMRNELKANAMGSSLFSHPQLVGGMSINKSHKACFIDDVHITSDCLTGRAGELHPVFGPGIR
jgi:hypothetical protein